MFYANIVFCLFGCALTVHALVQSQPSDDLHAGNTIVGDHVLDAQSPDASLAKSHDTTAFEYLDEVVPSKYLLSATSPNEDGSSNSIYRMSTDISMSKCLRSTDLTKNSKFKRGKQDIRYNDGKSDVCTVRVLRSSAGDIEDEAVPPDSIMDERQGKSAVKAKRNLNICSAAQFPGRPFPVCPSMLPDMITAYRDGTVWLSLATSMFSPSLVNIFGFSFIRFLITHQLLLHALDHSTGAALISSLFVTFL